ncbi:vertebrate ancient opsin-like [Anopheles nili]|uniref:vertebrate ancient opsin-like n=1 Tax=Anopheles nili TaxID=185578 RepID=UPI00237BF6B7|nr:vertebrate ancient opsin-like [Anopheles nili]
MIDVPNAASTDAGNQQLMAPWAYNGAAVTLFVIGFLGFFLNIFVIALMYKDVKLWTPMNIILFNLVCSDFSVSIIGNPLTLTSAISHRWLYGKTVCVAYGFFMSLLGIASITTLTVLSYERFCLISRPFTAQHRSKQGACMVVVFIWSYSFALTSPPLFGWGAYVNEAANISCSVNWESQTTNATSYIIFLFIFGLVLPLVVIIYSYANIIMGMRKNSARVGQVNRAERRVTSMVAVMIVAFMIAWTPYAVFALIEQFGPPELIGPGLAVLPALIAKSSICYNPIIYVGMNTQFRDAFRRVRRVDGVAGQPESNNTNSQDKAAKSTTEDVMECNLDFCRWTVRSAKVSLARSQERSCKACCSPTGAEMRMSPLGAGALNYRCSSCNNASAAERSPVDGQNGRAGSALFAHQDSELTVIQDGKLLVNKSHIPRTNML